MATISTERPDGSTERRGHRDRLLVPELWVALAVSVIWLVVLFDALFGPDIVSSNAPAGSFTRVPSAVVLAFFAWLATWIVAKYGFGRRGDGS
jgi:hypothetical protein